jgi:CRP-like cAMP-binding protein
MAWRNHFLDRLTPEDARRLRPHLAPAVLRRSEILDEAGEPIRQVYFPVDSILSVVTVMKSGAQVESRTIGRESGYGLLHVLGSPISFERMSVQIGGSAWRAPLAPLRQAAAESPSLVRSIVQHAQASIVQSSQNSACNSLHPAEQRLCRWLLLTQDRLQSEILPLTQEHLSIMLGVQRTTVTALASQLQDRGAISYVRGKISVHDRAGLERCACECYGAIQHGAEVLLDGSPGDRAP